MSKIHICSLSALGTTLATSGASNMISLAGPGKLIPRPEQIIDRFLALEFNDITGSHNGLITPNNAHVQKIIDFSADWNGDGALVVQCWMGVSRSTAATLIICAALNPRQDMDHLATTLRSLSPNATPNWLMIQLADQKLDLQGKLETAVRAIGRGVDAFEGNYFIMDTAS